MTAKEVQALLSDDEALVLFAAAGDNESYVFAFTRAAFDWKSIPLGGDALAQKVAAFRRGLDVDMVEEQYYLDFINEKRELFDLGVANELYTSLLGPVETLIKDKRHLIVVPFGPLTALPFHLLVTEGTDRQAVGREQPYGRECGAVPRCRLAYKATSGQRDAVGGKPQGAAVVGAKDRAAKPMIGFGNPVFNSAAAAASEQRGVRKTAARSLETGSYTDFWQGAGVDRANGGRLCRRCPKLPRIQGSGAEVGAPSADIHLGRDATETNVKRLPLADYRVVYFATHALVAGDITGVAEPRLRSRSRRNQAELDDGLLTASEVAQLKLNADWVVLSACNTIAGDKPGADVCRALRARSSTRAPARCWCRTGRLLRTPRLGSRPRPSTSSSRSGSAAPKRFAAQCWPT